MIFGIGTDIIEIARIEKQVTKDTGFISRVFTPDEINCCDGKKNRSEKFAARFAAKEAFMKALGTGWRDGIAFTDIEIINDELGKPKINLNGHAKKLAESNGIDSIHVSLSHTDKLATAVVILEK